MTYLSQLISRDGGEKGNERSAQIPRLETETGAIASAAFIKNVQFGLNGFLHTGLSVICGAPVAHIPLLIIPVVPVTVINPSISYRPTLASKTAQQTS